MKIVEKRDGKGQLQWKIESHHSNDRFKSIILNILRCSINLLRFGDVCGNVPMFSRQRDHECRGQGFMTARPRKVATETLAACNVARDIHQMLRCMPHAAVLLLCEHSLPKCPSTVSVQVFQHHWRSFDRFCCVSSRSRFPSLSVILSFF